MQRSISVRFTYAPEDSLRVAQFIRNQSFIYRNDVWLTSGFVFLAFIALIVFMSDDVSELRVIGATVFSAVPAVAVGIAVFLLHKVLNPWLMRRTINKYFDASPSANFATELTFSNDGLSSKTELVSSLTKWPAITKVVESDSDLLFYSRIQLNGFLPKSSLESADDLAFLKTLLRAWLNDKAIFL